MLRVECLIELMIIINVKRSFIVGELVEEFFVLKCIILRDLQVLESIGFLLYLKVGVVGGYYVFKECIFLLIVFLESEVKFIFFVYQLLEYYNDLLFE